jgi:hypothetical protein
MMGITLVDVGFRSACFPFSDALEALNPTAGIPSQAEGAPAKPNPFGAAKANDPNKFFDEQKRDADRRVSASPTSPLYFIRCSNVECVCGRARELEW